MVDPRTPVLIGGGQLSRRVDRGEEPLEPVDLTLELARLLSSAAPWGQAFPEPLFDGEFAVTRRRIVGTDHLRLDLRYGGTPLEAIAFNAAEAQWADAATIRAAYRLSVNEWQGVERLQLVIEHAEAR